MGESADMSSIFGVHLRRERRCDIFYQRRGKEGELRGALTYRTFAAVEPGHSVAVSAFYGGGDQVLEGCD